jgi:hypothetical protein
LNDSAAKGPLPTHSGQFKNVRNNPKEQGSVTFSNGFLTAVDAAGICDRYYGVCAEHPFRPGPPQGSISAKTVIDAARGAVPLRKLQGPGTVFQLDDLPAGLALNFIIQSRTTVETDFSVLRQGQQERGTFAVLCHAALGSTGHPFHNPPYPRPMFSSVQELIAIMQKLRTVLLDIQSVG